MCDPVSATIAAGALSATGSLISGDAASSAHKANAAQYEQQKLSVDQNTAIDVDAANRDYRLAVGRNNAAAGKSGVDPTAFYDILADDAAQANLTIQKIRYDGESAKNGLTTAARNERNAGRSAKIGSYFQAAGNIASSAASAHSKMPSPGVSVDQPFSIK